MYVRCALVDIVRTHEHVRRWWRGGTGARRRGTLIPCKRSGQRPCWRGSRLTSSCSAASGTRGSQSGSSRPPRWACPAPRSTSGSRPAQSSLCCLWWCPARSLPPSPHAHQHQLDEEPELAARGVSKVLHQQLASNVHACRRRSDVYANHLFVRFIEVQQEKTVLMIFYDLQVQEMTLNKWTHYTKKTKHA